MIIIPSTKNEKENEKEIGKEKKGNESESKKKKRKPPIERINKKDSFFCY